MKLTPKNRIYSRYTLDEKEELVEGRSLTVGELIDMLSKLEPTMKVGLRGHSGGEVRSISEVDIDTLLVAANDPTYATRGLYFDPKIWKNYKFDNLGLAVFID